MDLDDYYAEQEERMNLPDETVDEFLQRQSAYRSQIHNADTTSRMPQDFVSVVNSKNATPQPNTRDPKLSNYVNEKRKSYESEAISESATKRKKAADHEIKLRLDPSEIVSSRSHKNSKNKNKSNQINSPSKLEDVDSFTLQECDTSGTPKSKNVKRKTPPQGVEQNSAKKRLVVIHSGSSPAPSVSELSPISSFSRIIDYLPQHKPAAKTQSRNNVKRVLGGQQGTKSTKQSAPPTSPIEEPSVILPQPQKHPQKHVEKKGLAAENSKMYLEVKERIAKHAAAKHRPKVVKLGMDPVLQEPRTGKATALPIDESSIIYVSSSPSSRANSPEPVNLKTSKGKQKQKEVKVEVEKRKVKGKKEKPQPMFPADYARMLQAKVASTASDVPKSSTMQKKKKSIVKFLEGKNIFYTGGDMKHASETTRGRMDIIVRYGGNLTSEFDPNVTTHIITDAQIRPTLRALGLKNLKDIPDHIPTVKWSWLLTVIGSESVLSQEEIDSKLENLWMHAAFSERIDAGCKPTISVSLPSFKMKVKGKEKFWEEPQNVASTSAVTLQRIVSSPSDNPVLRSTSPISLSPSTSPSRPTINAEKAFRKPSPEGSKGGATDPLAEFYEEAKAQRNKEDGWSSFGDVDGSSDGEETDESIPESVLHAPRQKRGWACDNKEPQRNKDCPNQDIIDKLTELMELHKSKLGDEDHWRAYSYSKCIRALRSHPRRIRTFEEARGIRGVGEKTARKIEEILQTGELQRIKYEKTKDVEVTRLFQGIYGVGQSIAFRWYSAGCRTLQDLRDGKGDVKLSQAQEIGLKFYDDINNRMPRAEAKALFDLIKPIALSIDPRLFVEIMGSYRRGKADCGDIDIMITRTTEDGLTHRGVLPRLLRELHAAGILTEDLALPENPDDLEAIYRGLCRLPSVNGSRRRRIDFLSVPWTSRGAALLYYTGDDIFNRAIRLKANVLGYSLNQKGLFGKVVRDPRDRRIKMNAGVLVASETEEEIFKILGVPWQEPHERVRGQ